MAAYKVYIEHRLDSGMTAGIFITKKDFNQRDTIMRFNPNGYYFFQDMPAPGIIVEPTLRIPREAMDAFAEAMRQGEWRANNDSKIEGILEATRDHLADMRRLVFDEDRHDS